MNMADGINLELNKYCSYCPYFEPRVDKVDCSSVAEQNKAITTITCRNDGMCEQIKSRLNEQE